MMSGQSDNDARPTAANNLQDELSGVEAWRHHLQVRYQHDAGRAIARALRGDNDPVFIERLLELLRTYSEIPHVGEAPQAADESILHLAHVIAARLIRLGYWHQLNQLWPKLCRLAELADNADQYINFTKFLAIVKGRQGDGQAGFAIYNRLVNHPHFQAASPTLQADIFTHYATMLLWGGQRHAAAPLLQHCLLLTENFATQTTADAHQAVADTQLAVAPLWESRAYALNQQGVLHMFCGEFALAHHYFAKMAALFITQGEENNLACVAHQAIGRLLLYERNYQAALTVLTQGMAIRQRQLDREGIAVNSIYMAAAQLGLDQLGTAKTLLNNALQDCHLLENEHDLALCHLYLGVLARRHQEYNRALAHWHEFTTVAGHVVLHFVELRILLPELGSLLAQGQFTMVWRLMKILWQSAQHDQLSPRMLWRFL
ncbi:MAG: hypothetical protein R3C14_35940 [Caldilineaceae bacterium]